MFQAKYVVLFFTALTLMVSCKKEDKKNSSDIYTQQVVLNNANIFVDFDHYGTGGTINVLQLEIDELDVSDPKDVRMSSTGFSTDPVKVNAAAGSFFDINEDVSIKDENLDDGFGHKLYTYMLNTQKQLNITGIPAGGSVTIKKSTIKFYDTFDLRADKSRAIQHADSVMTDLVTSLYTLNYFHNNLPIAEP